MNIIFFGTSQNGKYFLRKLIKDYDIKIVVTNLCPDKNWVKRCRRLISGRELTQDVARSKRNIIIIDQEDISNKKFVDILEKYQIDLGIVATFGKIIPEQVITAVPLGIINVHPSLLPKYRGADPIFWTLKNGEAHMGITVHYLDKAVDTGDIILQKKISIRNDYTSIDCERIFFEEGEELLRKSIELIYSKKVKRVPQENSEATYYPPARDEYRILEPAKNSYSQIQNIIRAAMTRGGAILSHGQETFLIKGISKTKPAKGKFIEISNSDGVCFLLYNERKKDYPYS